MYDYTPEGENESIKSIEQVQVFAECPFKITLKDFEQSGLDLIFYNQDNYDTMAILQDKSDMDNDEITKGKNEQKLLSNRDLLSKNFTEVISNLAECEKYVQSILVSEL